MTQYNDGIFISISRAHFARVLLLLVFLFSLFSCKRANELPSPQPAPPMPETKAQYFRPFSIGRAVFYYSARNNSHEKNEQPIASYHPMITT